jgi:hypothetical protein
MRFHRFGADAEPSSDFLVRHPLHGPAEDLLFPLSQGPTHRPDGALQLIKPLVQMLQKPGQQLARRPEITAVRGANGLDEYRWPACFKQIPVGTMLPDCYDACLLKKVSEDQDFRRWTHSANVGNLPQPTNLGQLYVQQKDIWVKGLRPPQRLMAILGFTDDLNACLLHKASSEPLPEACINLSDEYRDRVPTAKHAVFLHA